VSLVFPHVRATFDVVVETNCSAGQVTALHEMDPITNENVESGHCMQKVLPLDSLNFPISQAEHESATSPSNPGLQVQAAAPITEFEFNGQSEQASFPATDLNFPMLQV